MLRSSASQPDRQDNRQQDLRQAGQHEAAVTASRNSCQMVGWALQQRGTHLTALCPVDGESLLSYHSAPIAGASSHRHSPEVKSCLQSASRIPLPEPTPPLESGNKEATLIGRGIVVPGVGSPFKATAIPLVRDSHPLFPYRILAPRRSWAGLMTGRNLSPHSQGSSADIPQEVKRTRPSALIGT